MKKLSPRERQLLRMLRLTLVDLLDIKTYGAKSRQLKNNSIIRLSALFEKLSGD